VTRTGSVFPCSEKPFHTTKSGSLFGPTNGFPPTFTNTRDPYCYHNALIQLWLKSAPERKALILREKSGVNSCYGKPLVRPSTKTLSARFRWPQVDRIIDTAQTQVPLGKGDLDFRFPETPVDFPMKIAFYLDPVIGIPYIGAKLEVE
jgi:hypothetical protein